MERDLGEKLAEGPAAPQSVVVWLAHKVEELSRSIERMKLAEYVALFDRPWRLMWLNFLAGVARGLGIAVGFSILGALVLYALSRSFVSHLPVLGRYVAELVMIVQSHLGIR